MAYQMTKEEKALAFDASMVRVLTLEFFRNTNIPLHMADNPKFQALLKYLRPDIQLPMTHDIIDLNFKELNTFHLWDQHERSAGNSNILNNERILMAEKHSGIPFDSGVSNSPNGHEIKGDEQNGIDPTLLRNGVQVVEYETIEYLYEEAKPEVGIEPTTSNPNPHKRPHLGDYDPIPMKEAKLEHEETQVAPKVFNYIDYKQIPCIVCQEVIASSQTRVVSANMAYIMIYLSYAENMYSMEKAKETLSYPRYNCCIVHFEELYQNALHHFEVVDPAFDVHCENHKILEAFHTISLMKLDCEAENLVKCKSPATFCQYLNKFFIKFQRKDANSRNRKLKSEDAQ